MKRLEGRIALVTGASRGIGQAVAVAYAKEGAELILLARTVGGLEETDDKIKQVSGKSALLVPCDLAKFDAIDQLAPALLQRFGRLDILLGNAGTLGVLSPIAHSDPQIFEHTLAVNLTANYRLIRALDPLLRKSEAARALFVTSGLAQSAIPYWNAYAVSKAALEHMVALYAAETAESNIRAYLVDPGEVDTKMHREALPGANPGDYPAPETIVETFIELAMAGNKTESGSRIRARAA